MRRLVHVIVLVGIAGAVVPSPTPRRSSAAAARLPRWPRRRRPDPGRDSFEGDEPDPPDEEKDEVLDWEGPDMTHEPNCFSANPCPP